MPSSTSHRAKSELSGRKWLRYKPVRILGEGGTGVACLALEKPYTEATPARPYVVLKLVKQKLREHSGKLQKACDALRREGAILKRLHHPNIVGFRDLVLGPCGEVCLVLQRCNRGDVQHFMNEGGGRGNERVFRHVLKDVASALDYLRTRHIVHNDVKGENVFIICDEGSHHTTYLLGDFDHATQIKTDGTTVSGRGTPGYASPESLKAREGLPYGFPSDIWSLGVLLVNMFLGARMFRHGSTMDDIILALRNCPDPDIRIANLSVAMSRLMTGMLSINPTARPTPRDCIAAYRAPMTFAAPRLATATTVPQFTGAGIVDPAYYGFFDTEVGSRISDVSTGGVQDTLTVEAVTAQVDVERDVPEVEDASGSAAAGSLTVGVNQAKDDARTANINVDDGLVVSRLLDVDTVLDGCQYGTWLAKPSVAAPAHSSKGHSVRVTAPSVGVDVFIGVFPDDLDDAFATSPSKAKHSKRPLVEDHQGSAESANSPLRKTQRSATSMGTMSGPTESDTGESPKKKRRSGAA